MTIKELLSRLLENTQNDSIEWAHVSSGGYRFVSNTGAVNIMQFSGGYYEIRLYDMDTCFATYRTTDFFDIHQTAEDLYLAIVASINRAIERKIGDVFAGM